MLNVPNARTSNRHPVDELAELREQIKTLKLRETELRDLIAGGLCTLTGDEHTAKVSDTTRETIDTAAMKRDLGMNFLRKYAKTSCSTVVRVYRR